MVLSLAIPILHENLSMNQAKAQDVFQKAIELHQQGKLAEAERSYRDILKHFPQLDIVQANLAAALIAQGRPDDGLKTAEAALDKNPGNRDAHNNKGAALKALGRIKEAIETYRFLTLLDPNSADAHFNLGMVIAESEGHTAAIPHYQKAVRLAPELDVAWLNLGHAYAQARDFRRAGEALRKVLTLIPGHPDAQTNLGIIHAANGYLQAAWDAYNAALEVSPHHFSALINRSNLFVSMGKYDLALQDLKAAEAHHPQNPDLWIHYGNLYNEQGHREEALEAYLKAQNLNSSNPGLMDQISRLKANSIPLWHFTMLEDEARNEAFRRAIERAVRPGMHVLDIGTGTGLLSLMAARAGADHVTACEGHPELASLAVKIIAKNGASDRITVHNAFSNTLEIGTHLPRPADVIVSEIVDAALLGEGVLPTLRHARANLGTERPIVIPEGARVYAMIAQLPKWEFRDVEGFDLSLLSPYRRPGGMAIFYANSDSNHRRLSSDFLVDDFDFRDLPPEIAEENPEYWDIDITAIGRGELNGVILWFELQMDPSDYISSGPEGELRHWGQTAYWLEQSRQVVEGERIILRAGRNDKRWWFSLT